MVLNSTAGQPTVIIGRTCGAFGIYGGIRVFSYTRPVDNIFSYHPWLLGVENKWQEFRLQRGETNGKRLVAFLEGITDRNSAVAWLNQDISIYRYQLPELPPGEFYWCDLMKLQVRNQDGLDMGHVVDILETGANGVLVVSGTERILIPLVMEEIIRCVDQESGVIHVQWTPGYQ